MPIKVLIADDHQVVRQALRVLLESEGLDVVAEASDGHQAVRISRELSPDVAGLDLVMPQLNGLDAAPEIRQASPKTRLVLRTTQTGEQHVLLALKAGFKGSRVVDHGAKGSRVKTRYELLTDREREVLKLLADGLSIKEIAVRLPLSVKTVDVHKANLMRKIGTHDRSALVKYAIQRKLIRVPLMDGPG